MPQSHLVLVDSSASRKPNEETLNRADIVAHQTGDRRSPIIVIRSWQNEIKKYDALAEVLGAEQPLYSIAPPDFETLEAFPQSTHDWVDFLRPRIEAIDHGNDFTLAGWSFGGVMALELAEALTREGRSVRQVLMVDSRLPTKRPATKPGVKMPKWIGRLGKHLIEYSQIETRRERLAYAAHRLNPARRLRKDRARKQRRAVAKRKNPAGDKRNLSEAERDRAERNSVITRHTRERMSFLKRTIHVAYLKYEHHETQIPITLFRTQESFEKSGRDPTLGWGPFAQGRFSVDSIGGGHDSIFETERLPSLANKIRRSLESFEAEAIRPSSESKSHLTGRRERHPTRTELDHGVRSNSPGPQPPSMHPE